MLRIIVDSGSSIKQSEKEKLGVDILPLQILFDNDEYEDGIDLEMDLFYHKLIDEAKFPKTSLPKMDYAEKLVDEYTKNGDDILFIAFSSELSGTYNVLSNLFRDHKNVRVVDSKNAVGGIRLLVLEALKYKDESLDIVYNKVENLKKRLRILAVVRVVDSKNAVGGIRLLVLEALKYKDESLDIVYNKVENLKKRLRILAVPETLTYLLRGGRLSKKEWLLGTIIAIKPIISLIDGKAKVISKKRGLKNAMKHINELMDEYKVDLNYPIIAEYSYNISNVTELESYLKPEYKENILNLNHI